jgi:hypothetical protein
MQSKTTFILFLVSVVIIGGVLGIYLFNKGKGTDIFAGLLPKRNVATSTKPADVTSVENEVLLKELDTKYRAYRKSVEERDFESFGNLVSTQIYDSVVANLKLAKKIGNVEITFNEFAPEVLISVPNVDKIAVSNINLKDNPGKALLKYKSLDDSLVNSNVVFENIDGQWKFVSENWVFKPNDKVAVNIPENAKLITFNSTSGFVPGSVEVKKGAAIVIKNVTGVIRTIGVANPKNFNSTFLVKGDYLLPDLPVGKYQYGLIFRGPAPFPFWKDGTISFAGEFTIVE